MKKIFACADAFIQASRWTMLAFLKLCLFSMGMIVGLFVPEKHKKQTLIPAFVVFLGTYIPLMADFGQFAVNYFKEKE